MQHVLGVTVVGYMICQMGELTGKSINLHTLPEVGPGTYFWYSWPIVGVASAFTVGPSFNQILLDRSLYTSSTLTHVQLPLVFGKALVLRRCYSQEVHLA